jgi:predicted nucleotidyltransferase
MDSSNRLLDHEKDEIVNLVVKILPKVQAIYVYGSVARGEGRVDSDVDIAIMHLEELDPELVHQIRSQLGLLLHRDIDILDMFRASTEMAFQAMTGGICLFGGENEGVALYETSLMSRYANLQIERREIVNDIVQRGKVYGD